MSERILLCTDLDRTLLPNGLQPESPRARERFTTLAQHSEVTLAYVTGRHRELVLAAMEEYALPVPDFVVGDVGTTIYAIEDKGWRVWLSWLEDIGADWAHHNSEELSGLFEDLDVLRLQEPEKQNLYKLSYYTAPDFEREAVLTLMRQRLQHEGVRANLILSLDETSGTGLLDVLPERASKRHAIEFLMAHQGVTRERVVFCGDSGNDLQVLVSPIPGVLVANATAEVRAQAEEEATRAGNRDALYLARGGFRDMNGNYSAGILEGLGHFIPESADWWD